MKKLAILILSIIVCYSCSKNDYLDATIDNATVEFTNTTLNQTISFIETGTYDIAIPIQIFGGTSAATLQITSTTDNAQSTYTIAAEKQLNNANLDSLHVFVNTNNLKKGKEYCVIIKISSKDVAISNNYATCELHFSQQAFIDYFTGEYSCFESSTDATYNVSFVKLNDTTTKNMNFWDFPLSGQYVPFIFQQDDSKQVTIPAESEWTDNLGNKYLISGNGEYDLLGNFYIDFEMKIYGSETIYQSGRQTYKKQ